MHCLRHRYVVDSCSNIRAFSALNLYCLICLYARYKALNKYFGEVLANTAANPFFGILWARFEAIIFPHTNYVCIHFTLLMCISPFMLIPYFTFHFASDIAKSFHNVLLFWPQLTIHFKLQMSANSTLLPWFSIITYNPPGICFLSHRHITISYSIVWWWWVWSGFFLSSKFSILIPNTCIHYTADSLQEPETCKFCLPFK